jgi:hypothetical protein
VALERVADPAAVVNDAVRESLHAVAMPEEATVPESATYTLEGGGLP